MSTTIPSVKYHKNRGDDWQIQPGYMAIAFKSQVYEKENKPQTIQKKSDKYCCGRHQLERKRNLCYQIGLSHKHPGAAGDRLAECNPGKKPGQQKHHETVRAGFDRLQANLEDNREYKNENQQIRQGSYDTPQESAHRSGVSSLDFLIDKSPEQGFM